MRAGRRRAWAVTVIVALAAIALTSSAAAARAPNRPTTNVTAYAPPHRQLPPDPVLHVGQSVRIVVTGFAARATVTMQLVRTRYVRHLRADGRGVVHVTYVVRAGRASTHHLITFQGQPALPLGRRPQAADPRPLHVGDSQTITATIPRIGLFPYRLAGKDGSGGSAVGGASVHTPADDPGSGLAFTGLDIAGAVLLALLAVLAGAAALRAGRRRA